MEVGLDVAEVDQVLAGGDYAEAVDADKAAARALGAKGLPFFVFDRRYAISGAQPADIVGAALHRAITDGEAS